MPDGFKRGSKKPRIGIIGAGLSGLCMAIRLKEAGFGDISLFEKADKIGGTWRDNTYPGVACDVPSHLYSLSFAPKADWSRVFSPGGEIQSYLESVAEDYDLTPHLMFGAELATAEWRAVEWHLTFKDGRTSTVDFLINGMGGLHIPRFPDVPGQDDFAGVSYHTAQWNHAHDLSGKRVAVIGTAASAIQLIPEIVDKVEHLDVYQRTPNYIMPRPFTRYSESWKKAFARFPWLEKLHRLQIYLMFEMRFPLFRMSSFWQRRSKRMFIKHLEDQVQDPNLREKLIPDYPVGCKRILASDTYLPALQRDNVDLITSGVDRITAEGIVAADGSHRKVDTIIYATGFKPWDQINGITITGRDGLTMNDYLAGGIRAHKTVTMPGFPNLFMLLGPNSALGHNSVIIMIEAQVKYILQAIKATCDSGARSVEAKPEAADAYDAKLQKDLAGTVWAGHCSSWYQGEDGRIYTLWPWSTMRYMKDMKRFNSSDYSFSMP